MQVRYLEDGSIRTAECLSSGKWHILIEYNGKIEVDYIS